MAALPLVTVALSAATPAWQEMPPLPQAIAGHALAAASETLWLVGGSFWTGDVWRRRLADGEWESVARLPQDCARSRAATICRLPLCEKAIP